MLNSLLANMSNGMIADVICLAIIAVLAITNLTKGLFKQIFKVLSTIGAIFLAYYFCDDLIALVNAKFGISATLSSKVVEMLGSSQVFLNEITSENLTNAVSTAGLPQFIADFAVQSLTDSLMTAYANVGEYLANIISNYILLGAGFICIYIVAKLVFFIIRKILEVVIKLPIIHGIDRFLGLILGLIEAALILCVGIYLIDLLPFEFLQGAKTAIADSMIGSYIQTNNFFAKIMTWALETIKF